MGAEAIAKKRETRYSGFKTAYYMLNIIQRRELDLAIMLDCDISYSTLLQKMYGNRPIRKPERALIIKAFEKFGIEDPFNNE